MPKFTITAHIELDTPNKPVPPQTKIQTGLIRMEIEAKDESEARVKARRFIYGKTTIVVDSCALKPADEASR